MAPEVLTPPASEPVSLAEARAHLRVTTDEEDALIGRLIASARQRVEAELGIALITTAFREGGDGWELDAVGRLNLGRGPLIAVDALAVANAAGTFTGVPADRYLAEIGSRPGTLVATGAGLPAPGRATGGVRIDYRAGFGADPASVPQPLRQAILLLVAEAFEHREPVVAALLSVEAWLAPWRRVRL